MTAVSFVHIGNSRFTSTACCTEVLQVSVLGPILFTIFVSPIALVANNHNVGQQEYADDTRLHISLSLNSSSKIHGLENCLLSLHSWFAQNGLALNPDKSDAVPFGSRYSTKSLCHVARRCRWHLSPNIGQGQATRRYP